MKICCTCKLLQDSFSKNKNTKDGFSAQCKICAKKYRETHKLKKVNYPSSNLEYKILYRQKNKNRANFLRKEDIKRHPEKYKILSREKYQKNKLKIRIKQAKYYQDNKVSFKKRNKKYRENNRFYILMKNRQRKQKMNGRKISNTDIQNLLIIFNNKCHYCGIEIRSGINLHLDHKIPLSKGGRHDINNLACSCATCNLQKGTMTDVEFLSKRNVKCF